MKWWIAYLFDERIWFLWIKNIIRIFFIFIYMKCNWFLDFQKCEFLQNTHRRVFCAHTTTTITFSLSLCLFSYSRCGPCKRTQTITTTITFKPSNRATEQSSSRAMCIQQQRSSATRSLLCLPCVCTSLCMCAFVCERMSWTRVRCTQIS